VTKEEKYLARIILKNKFYEADKQSFEDLFSKIMRNDNSDFRQPKPHGRLGDGKCDGFNEQTGEYYQVYAPEELKGNELELLNKMNSSIEGLLEFWNERNFVVKKFYYVVKDNYKEVYPLVFTNAKAISKKRDIDCEILMCKDIEDIFMKLDENLMIDVLGGMIPNPDNISTIDFNSMDDVVNFLKERKVIKINEIIPANPNFDEKIVFNNLSEIISQFLNNGQRQNFAINDFFQLNSKFIKEDLREIFNSLYNEAIGIIPESETKNDEIYQYIVEKSSPNGKQATYDAVYVLMAYYFEYCDIFETPNSIL